MTTPECLLLRKHSEAGGPTRKVLTASTMPTATPVARPAAPYRWSLFQHFRGNLDSWDPALIDALAAGRRVITFDYAGVGGSTGTTASTVEEMAREAIAFIAALELGQVDPLGFSIGSFVA
jgi:pimeloyl-ACP methyl ester carboxylesterase